MKYNLDFHTSLKTVNHQPKLKAELKRIITRRRGEKKTGKNKTGIINPAGIQKIRK